MSKRSKKVKSQFVQENIFKTPVQRFQTFGICVDAQLCILSIVFYIHLTVLLLFYFLFSWMQCSLEPCGETWLISFKGNKSKFSNS